MAYERTVAEVRELLRRARRELDAWFDAPADVRAFRPVPQAWSIDEILEHVSLTNHFLLLVIEKHAARARARADRGGLPAFGESDLARLERIGRRGSFPWTRPEHMQPTGSAVGREVRSTLASQFDHALAALERTNDGAGALVDMSMSVDALGALDLYQWLAFLAQHALRHAEQMRANARVWG